MFTKRIIPCLDVHGGRVVKGVNFVNLKDAGDPVEIAAAYDQAGADEVVFLDITASSDARTTVVDMVRRVAEKVFIPFTVFPILQFNNNGTIRRTLPGQQAITRYTTKMVYFRRIFNNLVHLIHHLLRLCQGVTRRSTDIHHNRTHILLWDKSCFRSPHEYH